MYHTQIGIVKTWQRSVSKDIKYFDGIVDEARLQSIRFTKNLDRGTGTYDIQYLRLHWVELNLSHLKFLRNLLNEVFYRHISAVDLKKSGTLTPDNLRQAVKEKLGVASYEHLPLPFSLNPDSWAPVWA